MGLIAPIAGRVTWGGRERRAADAPRHRVPAAGRCSGAAPRPTSRYALAAAGVPRAERAGARRASCWRWSASPASATGRRASSPAASSSGSRSRARSPRTRRCCSSTSRPRASIRPPPRRSRTSIRDVAARGIKVVMSTHDLGEARRLAGEIVLMHRGRVDRERPTPTTFFSSPKTDEGAPLRRRRACWSDTNHERRTTCSTRRPFIALAAAVSLVAAPAAFAQDKSIVVASTTSTQDSGLFGHILPLFKAKTGIDVKVVSQGTGQALDTGRRGDADVVFVHAKPQEEKFVADGFGVKRYPGDVQRLHPDRAEERSRRRQGHKDIVAGAEGDQGQGARRSSRAATSPARTPPSSRSGRPPASTSRAPTRAPGTRRSARAWARRSTPRRPPTPMCSPTAAPGCRSRTAAISTSWSKATSGCSTSTASSW